MFIKEFHCLFCTFVLTIILVSDTFFNILYKNIVSKISPTNVKEAVIRQKCMSKNVLMFQNITKTYINSSSEWCYYRNTSEYKTLMEYDGC